MRAQTFLLLTLQLYIYIDIDKVVNIHIATLGGSDQIEQGGAPTKTASNISTDYKPL
jgi:hypothetical protein